MKALKAAVLFLLLLVAGAGSFLLLGPRNFVRGYRVGYAAVTEPHAVHAPVSTSSVRPVALRIVVNEPSMYGSGLADITLAIGATQQQDTYASLPWVYTGSYRPDGLGVSVDAQDDGMVTPGTITCRITVDGRVVAQQAATGAYSGVGCAWAG